MANEEIEKKETIEEQVDTQLNNLLTRLETLEKKVESIDEKLTKMETTNP